MASTQPANGQSILIIGAGLAGLSTGCYGRMNGFQTHIVEHHSEPGGVATTWKHDDYLIDGGIHYLMGHKPGQAVHEIYRQLGVFQNRHYPDLTTYVRFVDETDGSQIRFTSDLDRLAADLKKLAPEDTRTIDALIAGVRAMQKTDLFGLMETPPEMMGLLGPLKQLWGMRRVLRYFGGPFNKSTREFSQSVHNEKLRRILMDLFLPEVPVWFVLLLLGLLANRQMGMLDGGCVDLVHSLVERYENLGGRITYDATVTEIIVENGKAVGVRLANGTEHRADIVVSAADGHSTIFKLLGGRYVDEKLKQKYQNWKVLSPIMTVSFGVKREFAGEPALNFILLKDPLTIGGVKVDGFPVRLFNYGRFSPPGKTVVQALLHTDFHFWKNLQQDRARYEVEKQRVCADVLACFERHYPGITAQVEVTDIATPYTTWRYTLNHEGAFMGWMPTPQSLRAHMTKTLPGLANFYMAGQWVVPGGGVPPVLYSGRHVIQMLCHRAGKKFTASIP